jgi:hypothetical protein
MAHLDEPAVNNEPDSVDRHARLGDVRAYDDLALAALRGCEHSELLVGREAGVQREEAHAQRVARQAASRDAYGQQNEKE